MTAVLLLNASYEPIRVISWQHAITLFFKDKVEVVEEYDHEIRSVSVAFKAPSIVRLLRYVNIGSRTPPFSRFNILARDRFQCQYCASNLTNKEATLDHIVPRSKGGKTSWENVVCCCKTCNVKKGAKTLDQIGFRLKVKPIRPDWLPVLHLRLHGNVPSSWQNFLEAYRKRG